MLVDFYYLERSPLERVLPRICERVIGEGERLLVVSGEDLLRQIDGFLWTYAAESFLPHGRADAPRGQEQPILLSPDVRPLNGARNVALADGLWRDEALGFERTFYFFDKLSLDTARGSWRALKERPGVERRYWKQDEQGKWVQGP